MSPTASKVETTDLQQRLEVCSVCELRKDDRCTVCVPNLMLASDRQLVTQDGFS